MSTNTIPVGVLDIQGSVEEHLFSLRRIGVKPVAVKTKKDLAKVSGLIIPGGESTTIGKLLKFYKLDGEIKRRSLAGKNRLSIWGTCAGAILLAKNVYRGKTDILGLMNIEIERNAYGGQLDSFEAEICAPSVAKQKIPAVFIRAPKIKKTSPNVKILAKYNGDPVMVRQENLLATTFHPELTSNPAIHKYFVSILKEYEASHEK